MIADAPVIDVQELRKTYRSGVFRRREVHALRGVSFQVGRGEIFGLLGPNGAGKTTLIKVLLGIVRSTGGSATMLGRPAGDREARRSVGYLPESHRIPRHHTGHSALEYYGALSHLPVSEVRSRRERLLNMVGLGRWGDTSVREYSKGMLQRLGLAQAMLHDPDLLILDEPTDGVDPVGRSEIRDVLHRLKDEGKTVFLNSHLLQEIELVCDRVVILSKGEVRRAGDVEELTKDAAAEALFSLEGDEQAVRAALTGTEIISWEPAGERRFKIALRIEEQQELDGAIDRLRERGISIYAVARRRVTLEQAFLEAIRETAPAS